MISMIKKYYALWLFLILFVPVMTMIVAQIASGNKDEKEVVTGINSMNLPLNPQMSELECNTNKAVVFVLENKNSNKNSSSFDQKITIMTSLGVSTDLTNAEYIKLFAVQFEEEGLFSKEEDLVEFLTTQSKKYNINKEWTTVDEDYCQSTINIVHYSRLAGYIATYIYEYLLIILISLISFILAKSHGAKVNCLIAIASNLILTNVLIYLTLQQFNTSELSYYVIINICLLPEYYRVLKYCNHFIKK